MKIERKLSIPLILITIGNSLTGLVNGRNLGFFFSHCLIFIPIIILFLSDKFKIKKKIVSYSLLGLSYIGFWFLGDSTLVGTTLFCFSMFLMDHKQRTLSIYGGIGVLIILTRLTILGLNVAQMTVFISGASFIFIFYHHYIHPVTSKNSKMDIGLKSEIPEEIYDIMILRLRGLSYKQIPDELGLDITPAAIGQKLNRFKDKLGLVNNEELLLYLIKNKSICLNDDKTAFI